MAALGLTLVAAIAARWLVLRFTPVLAPKGKLKTVGLAWLLGLAGSYLAGWLAPGPTLGGASIWGAIAGALVAVLARGLYPFLRIMVGRV
ncbi:MAG: hypothetical protein HYY01_07045 [Chloroflexi bacterium]|nr:hypothetical protein [Chloroflexota bacterium]